MKKIYLIFIIFIYISLVPASAQIKSENESLNNQQSNSNSLTERGYPVWIDNPNVEGYKYTAIGYAKASTNKSIQKRIAKSVGMAEISKIIKVEIDNEIKTNRIVDNVGNDKKDIEIYSKQKSDAILKDVDEIDSWIDNEGNYYMLLGVKND